MKAGIIFTGSGPILILTTYESFTDLKLVAKLNKKGIPKYEGKVHKIKPEETDIVKRIYKEFIEGKSL